MLSQSSVNSNPMFTKILLKSWCSLKSDVYSNPMFNSNPNCFLKSKRDSQSLYLPEKQKQKAIKTQNDTGEKKSLGL